MLLPAVAALLPALFPLGVGARWSAPGVPNVEQFPDLEKVPDAGPKPPPDYMVSNQFNIFGAAPDKGSQNGPVWDEFGGVQGYLKSLATNFSSIVFDNGNITIQDMDRSDYASNLTLGNQHTRRQGGGFWLTELGPLGKAPMVEQSGYKFYRNVKEYGAKGDGVTDDTKAINAAISAGDRCGESCGNTFAMGAIVYFPPGTYKVCRPIIQLYYTQFVGDPHNRPVIKGCSTFKGIGLIDTDVYIPGMNGAQWYINQNQFFRQIRNFEFDLRDMPLQTDDAGQPLAPTGIHWQVSQATSLQNLKFVMPRGNNVTHVGIFTENGSGGFVSDLEFEGGNIGWRVGNQQYTARGLKFNGCTTAVQMIWSWGFNWQQIEVNGGAIAFNITGKGGDSESEVQGTGSMAVIDSKFTNVPIGILTRDDEMPPSIVLDNLELSGVGIGVKSEKGKTMLAGGSTTVKLWAAGRRYKAGKGSYEVGDVQGAPPRPQGLLSGGKLFVRSRPQYESLGVGSFLVATQAPYNLNNDGTGDQTAGLNRLLADAAAAGKVAYFPAGIYLATGTVKIPPGSKLQGSSWSQIMCTGAYFNDMKNPKVFIQVGTKGQKGKVEIVEMMFTAKGPTAGAIMVEWNIEADGPGTAGMWDSHVRVGGARGSDLDFAHCPKQSTNYNACTTTSMLLHITSQASGYFENMWAWVADHDNDMPIVRKKDSSGTQISLFAARGVLIESTKPTWLYGTGSEHAVLYQYQLHKAKNVYLGHIQTEAPYFQPVPAAPEPFTPALGIFPGDPTFKDCKTPTCKMGWGLRLIDSSDIYFHTMGLYSWFNGYQQYCVKREDCQQKILDIKGKAERIAMYNLFTKASVEMGSGGRGNTINRIDNQNGYTAEVSVWFPGDGADDAEVVYLGPEVYTNKTAFCTPPCIFVLPPSPLPSPTVIGIPPFPTTIEVGHDEGGSFVVTTTTVTVTVSNITTDRIPMSNVNVTVADFPPFFPYPSIDLPPVEVEVTPRRGGTPTKRWITPRPWPRVTEIGAPFTSGSVSTGSGSSSTSNPLGPLPTSSPQPPAEEPEKTDDREIWHDLVWPCPPDRVLTFESLQATVTLDDCQSEVKWDWKCPPIRTRTMDAPSTLSLNLNCVLYTGTREPDPLPWPTDFFMVPIPTPIPEEEGPDEEEDRISCKAWFFFVCIDWPDLKIFGWSLPPLPPGRYKTGPPGIDWPKLGITVKGTLPKWPTLTIPTKGPIPTPTKPTNCKTHSAELCRTTTSGAGVVDGGTTRTTSVTTRETCATIYGCEVEDESTETENFSACTLRPAVKPRQTNVEAVPTLAPRMPFPNPNPLPCLAGDAVIFPADPERAGAIRGFLQTKINPRTGRNWWSETVEAGSPKAGFTAFFYVRDLAKSAVDDLNRNKATYEVDDAYIVSERKTELILNTVMPVRAGQKQPVDLDIWAGVANVPFPRQAPPIRRREDHKPPAAWPESREERLRQDRNSSSEVMLVKRKSNNRAMLPHPNEPGNYIYSYYYSSEGGEGQYVYNMDDEIHPQHSEFQGQSVERMQHAVDWGGEQTLGGRQQPPLDRLHGDGVGSKLVGRLLGVLRHAVLKVPINWVAMPSPPPGLAATMDRADLAVWGRVRLLEESKLEQLMRIMEDILPDNPNDPNSPHKKGRAVINNSRQFHLDTDDITASHARMLYKIIKKLGTYGVLFVTSAHNEYMHNEDIHENAFPDGRRDDIPTYAAAWGNPTRPDYLSNVLTVGAVDIAQRVADITPYADWVTYAPGSEVQVGRYKDGQAILDISRGSSYAAPLVAGIAAYLRSLDSRWKVDLQDPRLLKALIKRLERRLQVDPYEFPSPMPLPPGRGDIKVKTAWNGQVYDKSCLLHTQSAGGDGFPGDFLCPDINEIYQPNADRIGFGPAQGSGGAAIQYQPGPAGPLCTNAPKLARRADTDTCGKLCTGFYCEPNPTGHPPDYYDPEDPAHKTTTAPLPTLSGSPGLGDCPKTTSRQCVGSGGRQTCQDVTVCAPSPPKPTATSSPPACNDDACRDRQKLDRGNECRCARDSCDDNSPRCCATATCKACSCTGADCGAGAPACCGSGSCKWDRPEWTSGKPNWGVCRLHIYEWAWADYEPPGSIYAYVKLQLTSYMNDGPARQYVEASVEYGRSLTWNRGGSQLPADITIGVVDQENLRFTSGSTVWSSKDSSTRVPYCKVGDWKVDLGIDPVRSTQERTMDCYWNC